MFKRPTNHYGRAPEPVTPYQRAAQVWDDRIGSARVQARNWRFAFFGALLISGGLAGGLVWQAARGTITPWVVEVDKLGAARAIAPADADYRPTDPQIAFHLARFIEHVRSIPADPVVLRADWLSAYDFASATGAQALNDYARTNDPFAEVGKFQVAVDVSSVIRASKDSFRIAWTERRYQDGSLIERSRWSAIVTVTRQLFIEFGADIATGDMPPLFVVGSSGEAELVNYRVQGRYMIVDRLFERGELRLGAGKQARTVRIERATPRRRGRS